MKILIVDDSKAMRMIVMRHLRQAGYGDSVLVEAADWNMPNMNGYEFLQAFRTFDHDTAFGFVTSESTAEMRGLASDAGAAFLIAKPFTVEAFQEALSAVKV
jgi:two-component system chemotaxis response regulator CheY